MPKLARVPKSRWRGGTIGWEFRARVNGQNVVHALGTDTTEARRLALIYVNRYKGERLNKPDRSAPGTVAALLEDWLKLYVPRHRRADDHQMIQARLENHVLPIIGKVRLHEIRKRHLTELAVSLASKGLAVNTQRHTLSDVRCSFNWALDEEMMETSPFVGRKILPTKPRHAPQPLTDAELAKILEKAPEPFRSAIVLGVRTGLRWGEQRNLTWRHAELDSEEPSLTVERSKGGKPRRIPLDAETVEILKRWQKGSDSVYVQSWRPKQAEWAVRLTSGPAGVRWHWHMLRHTFATQYLRDGGSIEALSKLLGHSEVRTTEIYGAIEERLIRADFTRVRGKNLAQGLAQASA